MESPKLGTYIEQIFLKNNNSEFGVDAVVGISTQKEIITTKANLEGVNLDTYKLFPPMSFAYVPDTSRRGDKIALAFNRTESTYIVSSIYIVFKVVDVKILNPWYLFMFFYRPEFDRYARFSSWGSARETFSWEDMCNIEIELPTFTMQQKYVDIYKAMVSNQQSYETGLKDLKIVCDAFIEELRRKMPCERIGKYLIECDQRNDCGIPSTLVRGISTSKEMIPTKADMNGVDLANYKTVSPGQIVYVSDTSRRGDKISLGFNNTKEKYIVSSISTVFETKCEKLIPEYLMLFLTRAEFDRYARFCSWGSARETFEWEELCEVAIPIPEIGIQKAIAEVFEVLSVRKRINEQLKDQIRDICPVLIKGSLEEVK